jgi:anti-anti-sigma factor
VAGVTVTSIRSRSADSRRFSVASTSLTVACHTRGRGVDLEVTVAVAGEVDAANAKHFAHLVREAAGTCGSLILDLTEVHFMAFDGASALYALSAHLGRQDVPWCVVPSPAVSRVLQLCDPEGLIPLAHVASLRGAEFA